MCAGGAAFRREDRKGGDLAGVVMSQNDNEPNNRNRPTGIGIVVGAILGIVLGAVFDQLAHQLAFVSHASPLVRFSIR